MRRTSFLFFICIGIVPVYYLFSFNLPLLLGALSASSFLCSTGIVLGHHAPPGGKRTGLYLIALGLGIFFGLSLQYRLLQDNGNYYRAFPAVSGYSGIIYRDSVPSGTGGFTHYLSLRSVTAGRENYRITARGRVAVYSSGEKKYYTGRFLALSGKLEKSAGRDTHFYSYVPATKINQGKFSTPLAALRFRITRSLEGGINRLGSPAAGLFMALFLGAKEQLPPALTLAFRKTGTLHLLALSGLHVGIIYLLITFLLFPLRNKIFKLLASSLLILAYLWIVGPRPSLLRASLMLLFLGVNRVLQRQTRPLNILALAAVLILLLDPAAGSALSFQLSFLALLGIILIGGKLTSLLASYLPKFLLLPLACSLGAQFATAPLILIHFEAFYPTGILVTLLLVPLVTVFLWAGLLLLLLGLLHWNIITLVAAFSMNLVYNIIASVTGFFTLIPGLTLTWKDWYGSIYAALFCLFLCRPAQIRKILTNLRRK